MTRSYQLTINSCGSCPFQYADAKSVHRCRRSMNGTRTGYRPIEDPDVVASWCPLETEMDEVHFITARNSLLQAISGLEGLMFQSSDLDSDTACSWMEKAVDLKLLAQTVVEVADVAINHIRDAAEGPVTSI